MRFVPTKDAKKFATIGPEDDQWSGEEYPNLEGEFAAVDFVRLRPPPGMKEEVIDRLRKGAEKIGAVVKYIPANEAAVITEGTTQERVEESIRETVVALTREAKTSDSAGLMTLIENTLAAVGL